MNRRVEILEHTADVGLRGIGDTIGEAFSAVGEGLAAVIGARMPGEGSGRRVTVTASDREALLVAWVDELLFLHESEDALFGGIDVEEIGDERLTAMVRLAPRATRDMKGEHVKAATYHRLRVERRDTGEWIAEIYLDV